jgi:hypothetical protein
MSESYYSFEMFCSLLNNQNILKKMPALVVQGNLQKCVEHIKISTLEKVINLDERKNDLYLELKINQIKKQDYLKEFGVEKIQRWLDHFNIDLKDILDFNVESELFKNLVGSYYLNHEDDQSENYTIAKFAQDAFLNYFLSYYANILITFFESIKSKPMVSNEKKSNQLSANQIVLLLQEIGFFNHPKVEDAPKVKQANLISLITGLNEKNIKTNIQKLDKKSSELTTNYQKDIDKINKILDDLV